jgi:hypothetical protein
MDDSIDSVRRDIAETRARLSDTLAELDNRVDTVKHAVTQTANPLPAIREHPWIALGLALGAGIAIGMSGADRAAAAAAASGVKKAGPALMGGAKAAASGIKDMVTGNGGDGDAAQALAGNRLATYGVLDADEDERPSATHRVLDAVRDTIESRIDEVTNSLLEASREFLVGRRPSGV